MEEAVDTADWFFKIFLYYLLLVCVVRTPARMKWLLASLVIDGCIVAGLGVADYKGIIQVPNLIIVMEVTYDRDGEEVAFRRLAGTGRVRRPERPEPDDRRLRHLLLVSARRPVGRPAAPRVVAVTPALAVPGLDPDLLARRGDVPDDRPGRLCLAAVRLAGLTAGIARAAAPPPRGRASGGLRRLGGDRTGPDRALGHLHADVPGKPAARGGVRPGDESHLPGGPQFLHPCLRGARFPRRHGLPLGGPPGRMVAGAADTVARTGSPTTSSCARGRSCWRASAATPSGS